LQLGQDRGAHDGRVSVCDGAQIVLDGLASLECKAGGAIASAQIEIAE